MKEIIFSIIGALIVVFIFSAILALPIMWLWNYLMPEIFGLKEIGFWQSLCLLLFCGLLIKSSSGTTKSKE